jgi:hypothetical protein
MSPLAALDKRLAERTQAQILALAVGGVAIVGYADFLTGHELSVGLFYLAPVTLAAWYVGRGPGVAIAVLCSMTWYIAAIDNPYSHPAIPVWNALVRLGFFLICGLLLSALRASLSNAQRLARMDSVTGLFSRRAFMERLEHDLAFMQRRKSALTLVYVDLDDFKAVNDTHGHAAGDRVLRAVGQAQATAVPGGTPWHGGDCVHRCINRFHGADAAGRDNSGSRGICAGDELPAAQCGNYTEQSGRLCRQRAGQCGDRQSSIARRCRD